VDFRVLFTQKALKDLAEIIGHIAEDGADAASRFGNSLLEHIDLLHLWSVGTRRSSPIDSLEHP
jgi:plasmid stabilization system protein ParE